MAVCRAPNRFGYWREGDSGATCLGQHRVGALDMTKKYAIIRTKIPKPTGGFLEALELGLVDLNCWGEQHYDAAGYPYPDEVHAFVHDWLNLSDDFSTAMQKMNALARQQNAPIAGATDNGKRSKEGQSAPQATAK